MLIQDFYELVYIEFCSEHFLLEKSLHHLIFLFNSYILTLMLFSTNEFICFEE